MGSHPGRGAARLLVARPGDLYDLEVPIQFTSAPVKLLLWAGLCLGHLPDLEHGERLILVLYYYEQMTMKQIGDTLDLSESRVSQMHSSIVARLQSQLAQRRPEFSN